MFNILRLLENRLESAHATQSALLWVLALALCMFFNAFVESWLLWVGWAQMAIPVRALLAILIFTKSTRRKDAKAAEQYDSTAMIDGSPAPHDGVLEPAGEGVLDKDGRSHSASQRFEQSASNLVAVDTKRISDFASLFWFFPASAVRLVVSTLFLYSLIGWASLLAGILAWSLTVPINIVISRRFSSVQGDLMKVRDRKLAAIMEALQSIRHIKFAALESQWDARIGEYRNEELSQQWKAFLYQMGLFCLLMSGPVLLSTASLITYACTHPALRPSVAFTTIAIFGYIEFTLSIIPMLITQAVEAWISICRVETYVAAPERDRCVAGSDSIFFEDVSVAWPSDAINPDYDRFVLRALDLNFPLGALSVISGKTGSGKSLLLAAILGEADKLSGTIRRPQIPPSRPFDHKDLSKSHWIVDSAMAYVAQVPWIENATIKDNILFGLPYSHDRYQRTLSVCALDKDVELLPDGDLTDIGANGINLSGGQRWRISFARALYSRAGILVLDDVLSSLDSQVGRQLLEEALGGDLGAGRTRILVTHHVDLCQSQTRYEVKLENGMAESASLDEGLDRRTKHESTDSLRMSGEDNRITKCQNRNRKGANQAAGSPDDHGERAEKGSIPPKTFMEEESRETGKIQPELYRKYISSAGGLTTWVLVAAIFLGAMCLDLIRTWWVAHWTRTYQTEHAVSTPPHVVYQQMYVQQYVHISPNPHDSDPIWKYLAVYAALSATTIVIGTAKYAWAYAASIKASRNLFDDVMSRVLRAPLRWLDTVPNGRILNRFTADFSIIDSRLVNDLTECLFSLLEMLGISIASILVSPIMVVFAAMSMGVGSVIGTRMQSTVDLHTTSLLHLWLFNQWMSLRLSLVAASFASLLAVLIVLSPSIDASLAGFALAFAIRYNDAIIWTIRTYASLEMDMNATERIVEYTQIATEDPGGNEAPLAWPAQGRLEVKDLVVGYAPDLPPVLHKLSFTVEKNQRVGVVGRTGAGKSSLTLALFRFLEAREGSITIDGIDISSLKLHDLRSRLVIIPQDPVLFSGTVRSNLNSFGVRTDAELRAALRKVHLIHGGSSNDDDDGADDGIASTLDSATTAGVATAKFNIFNSLSARISEGGLDLSQGQRQLLCLARAIVTKPKILILDEATSAVDKATDALIQQSIHREFSESTLLVIAHRLATVAEFDKILVMTEGRAVEFGTPRELMGRKGVFWDMVGASGDREALEGRIFGGDGAVDGNEGG
ncbi:MAG: hypothetical protein Q9169_002745 [Polycauliona sp. 2 TL-2023]